MKLGESWADFMCGLACGICIGIGIIASYYSENPEALIQQRTREVNAHYVAVQDSPLADNQCPFCYGFGDLRMYADEEGGAR